MKLYIPPLGSVLTLEKDWTFRLYPESRNQLWDVLKLKNQIPYLHKSIENNPEFQDLTAQLKKAYSVDKQLYWKLYQERNELLYSIYRKTKELEPKVFITLWAGSVLKMDRIYIRKGQSGFDSCTFYLTSTPTIPLVRVDATPELTELTLKDSNAIDIKAKSVPFTKKGSAKSIARFWAKLSDVNTMEISVEESEQGDSVDGD